MFFYAYIHDKNKNKYLVKENAPRRAHFFLNYYCKYNAIIFYISGYSSFMEIHYFFSDT